MLELIIISTSRKKAAVNKRILFPIEGLFPSQNEGFVKKICFHYVEKLLSLARISKKPVEMVSNSRRELTG